VPAAAPAEIDEGAIRRVIQTYARAIETRDLDLFRSVRPNLSANEESRLRASFEQVTSQQVSIEIRAIQVSGARATVRLARQDTIESGGRRQTVRTQQTLGLEKRPGGWVIVELGR
jgi:ketosteroid isomerase-like protein